MSRVREILIFNADFNAVDPDGRMFVTRRYASSQRIPEAGELVMLHDDEGNCYDAHVERADGQIVDVKVDFGSWLPSSELHRQLAPRPRGTPSESVDRISALAQMMRRVPETTIGKRRRPR